MSVKQAKILQLLGELELKLAELAHVLEQTREALASLKASGVSRDFGSQIWHSETLVTQSTAMSAQVANCKRTALSEACKFKSPDETRGLDPLTGGASSSGWDVSHDDGADADPDVASCQPRRQTTTRCRHQDDERAKKVSQVLWLAQSGFDPEEIARRTGMLRGEVELLIRLAKLAQSRANSQNSFSNEPTD